jgi:hypothetical protein
MGGYGMQNVRLASMKPNRTPAEDVRYRRNSGKHLLAMSSSQFDPTETLAVPDDNSLDAGFSHIKALHLAARMPSSETWSLTCSAAISLRYSAAQLPRGHSRRERSGPTALSASACSCPHLQMTRNIRAYSTHFFKGCNN